MFNRKLHISKNFNEKSIFLQIVGNGLKKLDFARQNLYGRDKCLARKNEKKPLIRR